MRVRISMCLAGCLAVLAVGLSALSARAETVVRYGISMADIPLTTGQPDRGAGAYQFTGYTIYDPLVSWRWMSPTAPANWCRAWQPKWKVDDKDKTKWRFALRKGVKFHDGSDFNADAVIWNLDKVLNDKAPAIRQAPERAGEDPPALGRELRQVDDSTIEITTKTIDSFFPYQMLWFLVSSPAQYEKLGKDWDKFASQPSGTGPFKLTKLVPRELAELSKNADYWDKKRIPKVDKLVLVPMPEALTRTNAAARGPGRPDRDAGARRRAAAQGSGHADRRQHHAACPWNYHLSVLPGSPWTDVRLRKALNLAIDRDAVVGLMNGLAKPAKGQVDPFEPVFRQAELRHQVRSPAAKKLVEEAGYSKDKPLKATFIIAQGGTGQMLSLPMNDFLQQSFKEIGIDIDFKVVELETLYTHWRKGRGRRDECRHHRQQHRLCHLGPALRPSSLLRFPTRSPPSVVNWGGYKNPKVDALITEAKQTFDPAKQDELIAQAHALVVDDAVLVWVVHDTNPHALSPKVKKFVQASTGSRT